MAKIKGKWLPNKFSRDCDEEGVRNHRQWSSIPDSHRLIDVISTATIPSIDYLSIGIDR